MERDAVGMSGAISMAAYFPADRSHSAPTSTARTPGALRRSARRGRRNRRAGCAQERHGEPATLAVVSLVEEEASRFSTAISGAPALIIGRIQTEEPNRLRGYDGVTMAECAQRDLDPAHVTDAQRDDLGVFIELHIEQGPFLEQAGLPIGIVERITGYRQYLVTLEGAANHAGTTPMDLRRDPMAGAAEIIDGVINTANRMGRPSVTTVGRMRRYPTSEPSFRVRFPSPSMRRSTARAPRRCWSDTRRSCAKPAARRNLELTLRRQRPRASWRVIHICRRPCPPRRRNWAYLPCA